MRVGMRKKLTGVDDDEVRVLVWRQLKSKT